MGCTPGEVTPRPPQGASAPREEARHSTKQGVCLSGKPIGENGTKSFHTRREVKTMKLQKRKKGWRKLYAKAQKGGC